MIDKHPRVLAIASGLLIGALSLEAAVRAESPSQPANGSSPATVGPAPPPTAADSRPMLAPTRSAPVTVTKRQLDAFADLVGEPAQAVWRRMTEDPRIVPLALAAADARMQRQGSGRAMSVLGYSLAGASIPAGVMGAAAAGMDCFMDSSKDCRSLEWAILTTALLVAIGGLALGIAGSKKLRHQTALETAALEQYRRPGAGRPQDSTSPARPASQAMRLPAFSVAF